MTRPYRLGWVVALWAVGAAWGVREANAQGAQGTFDDVSPTLGELVPDVEVLDEKGEPFELRGFRGRHTVLVLGCLT